MVAATLEGTLSGLGRAMVQRDLLLERDAEAIQSQAKIAGIRFVEQLILGKKLKETEIAGSFRVWTSPRSAFRRTAG